MREGIMRRGRDHVVRLESGPLNALTDVPGLEVGHFTHDMVHRGTTAILCRGGATAGVSVRGANPGTLHTDALGPSTPWGFVHAIGLTGGTLYGLSAITGITEALAQEGIGLERSGTKLPVVAGAVIYDLDLSDPTVHPDATWGQRALAAASSEVFPRGNVGAGTGGTAGKGPGCVRTKGGLGTASLLLPGGIVVAALVVVNALGGLIHPVTGQLYAESGGFDIPLLYQLLDEEPAEDQTLTNTTLGVIATNAALDKHQLIKIADLAHDGLARAIRPMHTTLDGDTIFAISPDEGALTLSGTSGAYLTDLVGGAAADAMVLAVLDSAQETTAIGDWPSVSQAQREGSFESMTMERSPTS
jgi:L-aminopeptidase/D-esterase-like protein